MQKADLEILSDDKIPESIRATIATKLLDQRSAYSERAHIEREKEADRELERDRMSAERRKYLWNTPVAAAIAGLLTLMATSYFERKASEEQARQALTQTELTAALDERDKQLAQKLSEQTRRSEAEIAADAAERKFQFELVAAQIEDKSLTNIQRAEILWFLARSNVLTTLDKEELEKMVKEQQDNPNAQIFPVVNPIIPGVENRPHELVNSIQAAPWHVGITAHEDKDVFCNGVLVAETWVLTAGHCVSSNVSDLNVAVGSISQRTAERLDVVEKIIHPSHKGKSFDFALLKLAAAPPKSARPIDVRTSSKMHAHQIIRVTAWAANSLGGPVPDQLGFVDIPFVPRRICNLPDSYDGEITEQMFCAGFREGGVDVCSAASGAPATVFEDNRMKLVGIASWGEGCGKPLKYGVYSKTSAISDWINQTVSNR